MKNPSYYLHPGKGLGRLGYYAVGFGGYFMPRAYFRRRRREMVDGLPDQLRELAEERAAYYCRLPEGCGAADLVTTVGDLAYPFGEKERHTVYFLDLYGVMRYFPSHMRFNYLFGDLRDEQPRPTFVKSRPVTQGCTMSTLLKLNTLRHYRWIDDDPLSTSEKRDMIVFRGHACQPWRRQFLEKFIAHPRVDAGHASELPLDDHPEWRRPFMSVARQLKYRFIACLEGNDVASNLKWVMSSNSLAVMPRPRVETWFAEGRLVGGEHYVEVRPDFSDLIERMDYYSSHPREAAEIVEAAHRYIAPFRDSRLEEATLILTAERYFRLTGQM